MEAVYDVEFFSGELELINDPHIRSLTRETLEAAPAYIWYVPASITGKHHPPDDNQPGGLCWHLRKTAWVAYRMFNNLLLDTDIGVAAGLTHDIAHRGLEDEPEEGYDSYQKHGILAAELLFYSDRKDLSLEQVNSFIAIWESIALCVQSHMGRWGDTKPETVEQITFHLADVAASTKGLISLGTICAANVGDEGYSVADLVGRKQYFILDEEGELVFDFGKLKDKRLSDMAHDSNPYLKWILGKGVESLENPKGFPAYMIKQVKDAISMERTIRACDEIEESGGSVSLEDTLADLKNYPMDTESGPFEQGYK